MLASDRRFASSSWLGYHGRGQGEFIELGYAHAGKSQPDTSSPHRKCLWNLEGQGKERYGLLHHWLSPAIHATQVPKAYGRKALFDWWSWALVRLCQRLCKP